MNIKKTANFCHGNSMQIKPRKNYFLAVGQDLQSPEQAGAD